MYGVRRPPPLLPVSDVHLEHAVLRAHLPLDQKYHLGATAILHGLVCRRRVG